MQESLRIEGINRAPTKRELDETAEFLNCDLITVPRLCNLVDIYAPYHVLRDREGLNVMVGGYRAPEGGKLVPAKLGEILACVHSGDRDPWQNHVDYELLHPFTDGNGRSGRTLWLWQMLREGRDVSLSFLHRFYYQTLSHARTR